MRPLVNVPASIERVLYVFYDLETTQDTILSDRTNEHVPNLVCLQQFCSKCEKIGYRTGVHSLQQTHTLVLGRPCGRHVELSVPITTLGRNDSRDRSYCEGLRPPNHSI
jgi:hypothetical protein